MKIVKDLGIFRHTEEYEYTPTIDELYWYYSGTHAGYTRDNPYSKKYGMSVTKHRYTLVPTKPQSGKEE